MKRLITGAAMMLASLSAVAGNPLANMPGYGEYSEIPGYVLRCPVEKGDYLYWFAVRDNGQVALSRLGYPNGLQLFARVEDGQKISGGFKLLLRNEQGKEVFVQFSRQTGEMNVNGIHAKCNVSKTFFVL